jgi:hypothetical protein
MSSLEDNTFDIRIAICSLAIRHQIIERLVFSKLRDSVKCFSTGGGRHSPFYTVLAGAVPSDDDQAICRHCLNEISTTSSEVQGFQRDQLEVEAELIRLSRRLILFSVAPETVCATSAQEHQLDLQRYRDLLSKKLDGEEGKKQKLQLIRVFRVIRVSLVVCLLALRHRQTVSIRRRPPPRGRRGSCYSVHNPRPQPTILSENLSRFSTTVCESPRPLVV